MHFKMRRWWLLMGVFLVTSFPLPVVPCETGVAHVGSQLGVGRSLMANADVALLRSYSATSVTQCMEECCTGKYGSCSVASFKQNSTHDNCLHFYCRPLPKCKFLPSNSTDSFSFSSSKLLPSAHNDNSSVQNSTGVTAAPSSRSSSTREEIATFSGEQFAQKNDNTTVKPRKGVEDDTNPFQEGHPGDSVKPRKGVTKEDIPHSELISGSHGKSNVKPRKGVDNVSASPAVDTYEVMSALEKVFEDDNHSDVEISPSTDSYVSLTDSYGSSKDSFVTTRPSSGVVTPTLLAEGFTRQFVSAAVEELLPSSTISPTLAVSLATTTQYHTDGLPHIHDKLSVVTESYKAELNNEESMVSKTDLLVSKGVHETVGSYKVLNNEPLHIVKTDHLVNANAKQDSSKVGDKPSETSSLGKLVNKEETSNKDDEARYESSMHLVLALVFGLLVLFAVLGVVAKRVYDGWLRRDYYRMNYLIDGIYNGVD